MKNKSDINLTKYLWLPVIVVLAPIIIFKIPPILHADFLTRDQIELTYVTKETLEDNYYTLSESSEIDNIKGQLEIMKRNQIVIIDIVRENNNQIKDFLFKK